MKTIKDVKLRDLEPDTEEPEDSGRPPTGRIVHDERGNAVWKWRGESSSGDTTISGVLKYIDPTDLKVEGRRGNPGIPSHRDPPKPRDAGGGYDPYNQDVAGKKTKSPRK